VPQLKVGTFNLNNLFSRFNFEADVWTATTSTVETKTTFTFDDPAGFKLRKYKGRLVREKPAAERKLIADRIKRMDLAPGSNFIDECIARFERRRGREHS
jgi:hypothetical protein